MKGTVIFGHSPEAEAPPREETTITPDDRGLSREMALLLDYYFKARRQTPEEHAGVRIKVGETLSLFAHAYERLRYAVDYKKGHLLKRNAIERILKRILRGRWEKDPQALSEALIKELIWARYLRNDYYPLSKINEVAVVIGKYLKLMEFSFRKFPDKKRLLPWRDWLVSIASCEIEERLDPSLLSIEALSVSALSWFEKRYDWDESGLDKKEKEKQIIIAVHRGLFRSDDARTSYHLLKFLRPGLREEAVESLDERNLEEILSALGEISVSLSLPVQSRLYRFVQKQIAAFQVLKEVIEDDLDNIRMVISDKAEFEERIYQMCEEKYSDISARVTRGIIRSIVYIFITKIFFAILIEIPYEYYLLGGISFVPLLTTIAIPILFVILVALTIKRPGEANTARITQKIFDFVYDGEKDRTKFSVAGGKRRGLTYKVFAFAYGSLFFLTFAAISWVLFKIGFSMVGGVVFFIFLSLVLLFGYRVKFTASELNVMGERDSFLSHLVTNISLPLLDLGVWLSDKFSRFNFLITFLDFLIEAPLKNIIGVMDEWTDFVREKREEVVEIPVER